MLHRRTLIISAAVAASAPLAGCVEMLTGPHAAAPGPQAPRASGRPLTRTLGAVDHRAVYGEFPGEKFAIPPAPIEEIDSRFLRQLVEYRWSEPPGTIVVDPGAHHLYFVEAPGQATRYGVGVGREGFGWSGSAKVNMKRDWPDWVPPAEMIARDPEIRARLEKTPRGPGVPGGPKSPLGARAMYLFGEGRDLGYRIHGTTEPETVGTNVSSGCVRMINQDVVHLYARAPLGAPVVVLG